MAYENYKKQGLLTTYYVDNEEMVLINTSGIALTKESFDIVEQKRIEKQRRCGYNDRKAHCYDKWYRYNEWDEGKAYDEGVAKCVNEKQTEQWYKDDENFIIIENT